MDHAVFMKTAFASPSPGFFRSVPGAEYLAVLVVLQHAVPPIRVFTDHKNGPRHIGSGRAWSTHADRAFAGVWREIWDLIEDFGPDIGVSFQWVKAHVSTDQATRTGTGR